jgi:hypothetical protein
VRARHGSSQAELVGLGLCKHSLTWPESLPPRLATARKHLPLPDVAAAGGWKGTVALQRSYLHADEQTMLTVVLSGAELRDVKKA